jgi:large subunit ribosomal protein L24
MEPIKFHIKKNDLVLVVAGKEKGKSGRILRVLPKKNRVVVEKVNFVKRHPALLERLVKGGLFKKKLPSMSPMF